MYSVLLQKMNFCKKKLLTPSGDFLVLHKVWAIYLDWEISNSIHIWSDKINNREIRNSSKYVKKTSNTQRQQIHSEIENVAIATM